MPWGIENDHNPKWCRDEINRLRARETELLEANNRYQQEARDAKAALKAHTDARDSLAISREARLKKACEERDELAARAGDISRQIKAAGQRVGIIASRYGWRGGENNIDFIARKMADMQEAIDNGDRMLNAANEELHQIKVACNLAAPNMGPPMEAKKHVERVIARLKELQDIMDAHKNAPPPEARIEVAVTGMADVERRVRALENLVRRVKMLEVSMLGDSGGFVFDEKARR